MANLSRSKPSNWELELAKAEVLASFRWRTQERELLCPTEMATRHLWFTLRMIWNHSAPAEAHLTPFKHYRFGPFYTPAYMASAVKALLNELRTRKDIRPEWLAGLAHMADYVNRNNQPQLTHARTDLRPNP